MYEKFMIYEKGFRNIAEGGKITGFEIPIRVTHYHGLTLNMVEGFELKIDGIKYPKEEITFTVKGKTFTFKEMQSAYNVRWDFGELAYLGVKKTGGLIPGVHDIELGQTLMAYSWASTNWVRKSIYIKPAIKRGVSLYSYQQELYQGKLTFEGMIKAVSELGADGIEVLAEGGLPHYPDLSDFFVYEWFKWLDQYKCVPVCYDSSFDTKTYLTKGLDSALEKLKTDMNVAARLGFHAMRAQIMLDGAKETPLEMYLRLEDHAARLDLCLGMEIHAPLRLDGPIVQDIVEYCQKTGSKNIGLVPDFGTFENKPHRLLYENAKRKGGTPSIIDYVHEQALFRAAEPGVREKMLEDVKKKDGNEVDMEYTTFAFFTGGCQDTKKLIPLVPYMCNVHGKFYDISDGGEESCIDYPGAIGALVEGNYGGYICSEFEGQRYYHDIHYPGFEIDSVDQVRRHHKLVKRLIGEW